MTEYGATQLLQGPEDSLLVFRRLLCGIFDRWSPHLSGSSPCNRPSILAYPSLHLYYRWKAWRWITLSNDRSTCQAPSSVQMDPRGRSLARRPGPGEFIPIYPLSRSKPSVESKDNPYCIAKLHEVGSLKLIFSIQMCLRGRVLPISEGIAWCHPRVTQDDHGRPSPRVSAPLPCTPENASFIADFAWEMVEYWLFFAQTFSVFHAVLPKILVAGYG